MTIYVVYSEIDVGHFGLFSTKERAKEYIDNKSIPENFYFLAEEVDQKFYDIQYKNDVLSQITFLENMLKDIPEESVIDKASITNRIQMLRDELDV